MNSITIIGNIGQDAQLRQPAANGSQPISFTVAVSEKRGNNEQHTDWFNITKWVQPGGSTALVPYLKKGTKVAIQGKVSARSYTDRDGAARASLEINASTIELLGGGDNQQQQQHAAPPAARPAASPANPSTNHSNSSEDDLPF